MCNVNLEEPENGYTTEATVVRVVDGDTVEVEIRRRFIIRLTDDQRTPYWNVEEKTTELGKQAICFLNKILYWGKKVKVFIPTNNPENLMDFNSFSRIVGKIWVDSRRVTDIMDEEGYSNRSK